MAFVLANSLKFIEIAANLTDPMFKGVYNGKEVHAPDIEAVLGRAWEAGVQKIIVTGGSLKESKEALALADTDARLFCTVGVHPTRCMEFEESGDPDKHMEELAELAREGAARGKVVAIGECGLDYDRLMFCPEAIQQKYFERQFELAEATKLPIFLHLRAAGSDFVEIVKRNRHRFVGGVVHSFTGTAEERDEILAMDDMYIGINGCSLKTAENLSVMAGIPEDRILLETDSPYCDIRPTHAGYLDVESTVEAKKKEQHDMTFLVKGRNEPCNIRQVFEVVAAQRNVKDAHAFANSIINNTCRLFSPHDLESTS
eukprot:TRINITY_DN3942_c0_g1_i1.p1 TRINITY_DN3942_c0_g1~~TRINITY_DN3942_c0_g1_i1.p1  ORF type:complete len:315 (-),score=65.19 TRINITY_DN3942_c0_g1_i1:456-1400(-)